MGNFQLRVAAIAVAVLSVSALSAEAKPWKHRRSDYQNQQYSQRRHHRNYDDGRYSNRRDEDQRYDRYDNRSDGRYRRGRDWQNTWNNGNGWGAGGRSRTVYYRPGAYYTSLPSGCRRVVVRQTTYYTPDDNVFFTFNPSRNIYVVVNNPFRFF